MREEDKRVDESWKSSRRSDRDKELPEETPQMSPTDLPPFLRNIAFLASQCMYCLSTEDYLTKKEKPINLLEAQASIEILEALRDKTKGNLSEEENDALTKVLYDMRLHYLDAEKKVKDSQK